MTLRAGAARDPTGGRDRPVEVVVATSNAGKIAEIESILSGHGIAPLALSAFTSCSPEETGLTFVENAIIKARHASRASGLAALADDSGLVVDALGGAPGVRSARFAGDGASDADNVDKLLQALADVGEADRRATFACALVWLRHPDDPAPIICEGAWTGRIARDRRGANGFGYDPVFWAPEHDCTAAELTPGQKNRVSHRGKALARLVERIREDVC